jgi:rSAM/selenodomain-associated transferase 1
MRKPLLFVFAKAPVLGKAKTRLAKDTGYVHAKRLYRMMVSRVLRRVQDPRWETILAVTPPLAEGRYIDWDGFAQVPQVSGSLSPRLAACFAHKGPVIVIGTDSPQIRSDDIAKAITAMRTHQVVFGPAKDGGFWLIGAQGPLPSTVFDNVAWSTEQTLADVTRNVSGSVYRLRILDDIDDITALRGYRRSRPRFGN